ncbi:hypothetical protein Sjap_010530 [Stephania japonica]|uniref:Uncharacterized protein n=1 Tax=Stephania japonica TaxID=461633 RepID=A0AAP0P491_9MAGN
MAELDQTTQPKSEKPDSGPEEVVAAMHLIELSGDHSGEGSNCNNYEDVSPELVQESALEEEEEVLGMSRPRRQRYRSLAELYKITRPLNVNRGSRRKMKRGGSC